MWRSLLLSAIVSTVGCARSGGDEQALKRPTVKVANVSEQRISPRTPVAGVLAPLPGKDVKVGALVGIAAKQEVDDARAALVAAQSALKSAQATGGIAGVQLDRATLRAPIRGVVAAILVPAGQSVDGSGAPVIEIADTAVLDLRAPLSAARVGDVVVGQRAELDVEGVGKIAGAVEAIAPLVDPATNTVVVRIRVPNSDGRLRGGMFARGAILGAPHPGLAVPRAALLPGDGGTANTVAIVDAEGVASHYSLQLGAEAGEDVEVRSGLPAGARVIVAGGYALPDGTRVQIAP